MTKDFSSKPAVALALLAATGLAAWFILGRHTVQSLDSITGREVVSYSAPEGVGDDALIRYQYLGKELPEKLAADEDVSKRTESSYTRDLGVENAGAKEERHHYQSVFYSAPSFTKDGDTWRYIENATTTKAAFDAKRRENPIAALFWKKAYAASVSPFSGAGDGYTAHGESGDAENVVTFNDCNFDTGPTGSALAFASSTSFRIFSQLVGPLSARSCEIDRAFIPFDTSAIPNSATISAATLSLFVTAKTNGVNDGLDTADLVQTHQGSSGTVFDGDHHLSYDTGGATALDITSVTTSAYNVWTLNVTGIAWIKKSGQAATCGTVTGFTCLGLREGHDIAGTMTLNASGDSLTISSSENTGTTQDPFLSVTYTTGGTAFWQFQDY